MMSTKTISLSTKRRAELVDITREVQRVVSESGINDGLCLLYVPHTTAGITINEAADPDVARDILEHLEKLVPRGGSFRHREGNADSHIKSTLVGCSQTVAVKDGQLVLGTWQGIFFCEFDGPRSRRVNVSLVKG